MLNDKDIAHYREHGYVVARHSSDVGVKTGGRIQTLSFEEGTRVRAGQVIASIEHADLDAQAAASRAKP